MLKILKGKGSKGFTLLEVLLVVAAIAIIAGIIVVAIDPARRLRDTRNAQRVSDVNTYLNAIYTFNVDNERFPGHDGGALPAAFTPICAADDDGGDGDSEAEPSDTDCDAPLSGVDMYELIDDGYLGEWPLEPTDATGFDAGYDIRQTGNGRLTVQTTGYETSGADTTYSRSR